MLVSPKEAAHEMQLLLERATYGSPQNPETFRVRDRVWAPRDIIACLEPYLTPERLARMDGVLQERTYTVATVVEGIINTGNVRAIMRTAEALGYQGFHVITGEGKRLKSSERTSQGAEKWLDVQHWETATACAKHLKSAGYQIVATHLDDTAVPLSTIDFTQKTALVLGNERDGVSEELLVHADARCIIPMQGFVESFNISVAGAICLYHAYHDRMTRQGFHGDLAPEQAEAVRAVFYMRGIKRASQILYQNSLRFHDSQPNLM